MCALNEVKGMKLKMKELNLNTQVKIKLTDFEIRILQDKHLEWIDKLPENSVYKHKQFEITVDENGYTDISLFELMETFGQYITYNQSAVLPFENPVLINEKCLEDCLVEENIFKM